ncbi:MAG TPA: hypothetical protein DDW52_09555 [Planctomycetaceae bacterium]|nr:hypothetical protein [Planctomycetaceae bacterium]
MQVYDLLMLIVIGMATIFGAIKGFAWQVASLASVIVSYIVAYRFRFEVGEMIQAKPPWNQFLAMLILYVGTSFVIWVGFRLLSGMIDRVRLKEFDRHLGAAFGLAKGGLYCLLITMFAMSLLGPSQQAAICHSRSGYYISVALDRGAGILPNEIHEVVGPYLSGLDDKLNSHGQQLSNVPNADSSEHSGFSDGIRDGIREGIRDVAGSVFAGEDGILQRLPSLPGASNSAGQGLNTPSTLGPSTAPSQYGQPSQFGQSGSQPAPLQNNQYVPPLAQSSGAILPPATGNAAGQNFPTTQPSAAPLNGYSVPNYPNQIYPDQSISGQSISGQSQQGSVGNGASILRPVSPNRAARGPGNPQR